MKIAMINNRLNSGGAEKILTELSLELKKYSDVEEVDVILLTSYGDVYGDILKKNGIRVIYLDNKWTIYNLLNIVKLIKKIKKYDIVHSHVFPSQYYVGLCKLFFPKKIFITTEHSTTNKRRKKRYYLIEKIIYGLYNKIVCVSDSTEKNLRSHLNNTSEKIIKIYNGIDLEKYSKNKKKCKTDIKVITMIGRFSDEKNQETLIKAMSILDEKYKLFLVGEGVKEEKLKKMVRENQLEQKVFFPGWQSDINKVLNVTDISVLSSNWEGFGLVALESMVTGTPTIVSNIEGLREIVGEGAVLFPPENEIELASKINQISLSQNFRNDLIEKGIKQAEKFSLKKMAESYYFLYKKELS